MKIVISGNYGAGNIGDELILEGLLDITRKNFPESKITVLSGNPKETKEKHKVNSLEKVPAGFRSFFKSLLIEKCASRKAIKECDFFVMGGGGLFGGIEKKANCIWGMQALLPIIYKKPLIMVGQSIGRVDNSLIKFIIKNVFNRAKIISVRDVNSKKILKNIGVKGKIHVVPDNVFRLKNKSLKQRSKTIIVALRQMENLPGGFIKNISNFLKYLKKRDGWKIKFIDFQSGKHSDGIIHKKVIKNFYDPASIEHISNIKNKDQLFNEFAEAEFCLCMRLHSVIVSMITGTPFLALNYAPKIAGVVQLARLQDYILPLEKATAGRVNKKFQKILKNKDKISRDLDSYCKKAYNRHMEAEDGMMRNFNNSYSKFFQYQSY
ncbi:hypothetical protein GF354_04935 [Candidatus Peregrinibacteria bacterium]|nr:hypothetical protein [Candidatus Peregrinibacteria bacterium]